MILDRLAKAYIHSRCEYQYLVVGANKDAFSLERRCRSGAVFGVKPLLNPA
jgi:hypothetical protein